MQRTEQLMWILIYIDDVESDLSRFHGIEDWAGMPSRNFVKLCERLGAYGGCVTNIFAQVRPEAAAQMPQGRTAHIAPGVTMQDDPKMLVALTQSPSGTMLPGIEYSGG